MRKSLFAKIFFTQLLVAITIIFLIVPTTFIIIGDYFNEAQKKEILQDASRVAKLTESISEYDVDEEIWKVFEKGIEFAGSQSIIVVMDRNGNIVSAPREAKGINVGEIGTSFLEQVKNGDSVVKFYSKSKVFSEKTLVAIVPIEKIDALSGETELFGVAMALRPIPQLQGFQNKIISVIFIAQIIVWILAFIVSFFLTRQILKPVKKMRNAAKSIASGNFKERIPITSNDEIGQLAAAFNSMTESLNELENMRSSFISDVSHELRTPMTIICGFVEGIQDGTIPEEQKSKYLDVVLSEVKRLSRLVSDLLEASRLDRGKVKLNKKNVDMNRLVAESAIAYEQKLTEKNINVSLELDEEECFALADKDSIKRVIINLIDNAIKFTPEGGNISVTTERKNKKVYVSIKNSGDGIAKDELRRIWERFYKSDKSRSVDKKGVGLGLHIVKTIIAQHDGEIYAESEEGKYACFTFTLEEGSRQ